MALVSDFFQQYSAGLQTIFIMFHIPRNETVDVTYTLVRSVQFTYIYSLHTGRNFEQMARTWPLA